MIKTFIFPFRELKTFDPSLLQADVVLIACEAFDLHAQENIYQIIDILTFRFSALYCLSNVKTGENPVCYELLVVLIACEVNQKLLGSPQ